MKINYPNRSALVALLALACLGACKSTKNVMSATPTAAISKRLPSLEITADPGPLINNDGALPDDPLRLFRAEMQRNITEPLDSATFGYARLVVTKVHTVRTGKGLQAAQIIMLMTPSIIGIPLEWYKTDIQAEVQLLDANGKLLGTYVGTGTSKVRVAAYHGYSQKQAPRLSDVLALRNALSHIRPQLDTAATRLRPLLLASGRVPAAESAR
ncbi:MAG: hypothetical protein ACRYFX_07755 [Janthinobacterium lividum]